VVLYSAQGFGSISSFYSDFAQVSDAEVMQALEQGSDGLSLATDRR
jgi:predicted phosphoribosyltransferase